MLDEWLDELSRSLGADYYGVAGLDEAGDFIEKQGGINVKKYPRAISIGIILLDSIVDDLPFRSKKSVAVNYKHSYDIVNLRLDLIASRIASTIQKEGYKAMPIPASERDDDERISATFSHKLAANLAGLGWIGKNCLLITPESGPRVRWTSILTNAPLDSSVKPMENLCGDCRECVEICPVNAFTGESFRKEDKREVRYNAKKCEEYFDIMEKSGKIPVCGLCVYICPLRTRSANGH